MSRHTHTHTHGRVLLIPGVQDAEDEDGQPHHALAVPPLQVGGGGDGLLRAHDDHPGLVLQHRGGRAGGRHLLEDAEQARITDGVWRERGDRVFREQAESDEPPDDEY